MANSSSPSVTALLQALSLTNTLWGIASTSAPGIETQPSHRLVQEAELLHARLGSWLAQRGGMSPPPPPPPTAENKKARPPLSLLEDLPVPLLVHALTFLVPAKPGLTNTYQTKWADVGAFSSVSHKAHAAARDDVFWRPICEQLWGSVSDPKLRALWRADGWAALYQRMARSSMCVEHSGGGSSAPGGGYRLRWKDDYVIIVEVRDIQKRLVLFSEWGPLWCDGGDWMDPDRALALRSEYDATGERTGGCAAWIDAEMATGQHTGVVAARLLKDHPAMRSATQLSAPWSTQSKWPRVNMFFHESIRRGDIRLEVRLLHVPSAKVTTLYSAQHDDGRRYDEQGTIFMEEYGHMTDASGAQACYRFAEMVVHLPHGAEKIRVNGDLQVRMTVAEDDMDMGDGWLDKTRIGMGKCHVYFPVGDRFSELGSDRILYRMLQALPWTD